MAVRLPWLAWTALGAALSLVSACGGGGETARDGGAPDGASTANDGSSTSRDSGGPGCAPNGGVGCAPGELGYSCEGEDPSSGDFVCSVLEQGQGGAVDYCCSASAGDGGIGVPATPGCVATGELTCPGVAYAYGCAPGTNPGHPSLACALGGSYDSTQLYCCFPWSTTGTCLPQAPGAGDCPDPNAFAFRCATPGDSPPASNAELTCDGGTIESDGAHTDFCCSYE